MKIDNKTILIVIAVALVGIFLMIFMENNKETPEEKIGNSISDVIDNASDNMN